MPPKKNEEEEDIPLLGRFSSNLKMGIVGLPNVGKSTFFNILTKQAAEAANYPFCTIDPNQGRASVPDERFDFLCDAYKPPSQVPAFLQIVDIAGLVRGAHEGAGLGNAFLSHIQAVDGIYFMTRVFEDVEVTPVDDTVDPIRDMETIRDELIKKDMQFVKRRLEAIPASKRNAEKASKELGAMLDALYAHLEEGKDIRTGTWNSKEIELINEIGLITAKPVVYLLNLSEADYIRRKNKWLPKIKEWVDAHGGDPIIPLSCTFENKIQDKSPADRKAFLEENKLKCALDKIIKTGYDHLHLIHFFTVGSDEVKCWTIRKGTKAPQAAGTIHSDFERGFICAEVMAYDDFREAGSENAAKANGKYRMEGKGYKVADGDIILFKANTGAGLGAKKK